MTDLVAAGFSLRNTDKLHTVWLALGRLTPQAKACGYQQEVTMPAITKEMLRDYLNDALPDAEMASVEASLRSDSKIASLLQTVRDEIDRGEHSIGGIWRRERLSCPSRDLIGSYLLKALDSEVYDYIKFHLQTIGCPACQANYDDLAKKKADTATVKRRTRIVQSSEPALKKAKKV